MEPITLMHPNGSKMMITDTVVELATKMIDSKRTPGQADVEDVTGKNPGNVTRVGGIAADRLRSLVERIERLEGERKELAADIRDIYSEAKSAGFDVSVLRQLIRIRAKDEAEVEEAATLLDVYRRALA